MNPELKRNAWLELVPWRLWAAPLAIATVGILIYMLNTDETASDLGKSLIAWASFVYIVCTFWYGTFLATSSVVDEISEKTWNMQRMTSMGAWEMAWGKLFGKTSYAWYLGMWAGVFYLLGSMMQPTKVMLYYLELALVWIIVALVAQGLGFAMSLLGLQKNREVSRGGAVGLTIISLMVAGSLLNGLFAEHRFVYDGYGGRSGIDNYVESLYDIDSSSYDVVDKNTAVISKPLTWFSIDFNPTFFILTLAGLILGWTLLGLYRNMRLELQYQGNSWGWIAFSFFAMLLAAGFVNDVSRDYSGNLGVTRLTVALFVAGFLMYFMFFNEPKKIVLYRQVWRQWRKRNYKRFYEILPTWIYSFAIFLLTAISVIIYSILTGSQSLGGGSERFFILVTVLFALRDIGIVLLFSLRDSKARSDFLALIVLFFLYFIFPFIIAASMSGPYDDAPWQILAFFWPFSALEIGWLQSLWPILLSTVGVWGLLWKVWQTKEKRFIESVKGLED